MARTKVKARKGEKKNEDKEMVDTNNATNGSVKDKEMVDANNDASNDTIDSKKKSSRKGKKKAEDKKMVDTNNDTNDSVKTASKVKNPPKDESKKAPEEEPKTNQNKPKGKRKSDQDQNSPNKLPKLTYPEELVVGGLPMDAKEVEVREMLEKNGQILQFIWKESTEIKDGLKVAPIVFVKYATKEATDKTLTMAGQNFKDSILKVHLSNNSLHLDVTKSIFVGNTPADLTEEDVRKLFSEIGNIESVRVFETKNMSKAAVVNFNNQESATRAFSFPNPKIRDCPVRLGYNSHGRSSVFIGGAQPTTTFEEVRKLFSSSGEIKDIRIMEHKTKKGVINVFVDFTNEDSAKKAKIMAQKTGNSTILGTSARMTLAYPPKDPKLRSKQSA